MIRYCFIFCFLLFAFAAVGQPVCPVMPTNLTHAQVVAWLASNNVPYPGPRTNWGYDNSVTFTWTETQTNPPAPINYILWRCTDLISNRWEPIAITTNTSITLQQHYAWAFYTVQAFTFSLTSSNSNIGLVNLKL